MFPESKFTDILSQRWKWHSMSVAVSERTLPINLFHWPIQTPSHWWIPLDTLWAYRRAPLCLPFCTVMLMSVSLNTSFTLSLLSGFAIIHHFFLFEKKPKSDTCADRSILTVAFFHSTSSQVQWMALCFIWIPTSPCSIWSVLLNYSLTLLGLKIVFVSPISNYFTYLYVR